MSHHTKSGHTRFILALCTVTSIAAGTVNAAAPAPSGTPAPRPHATGAVPMRMAQAEKPVTFTDAQAGRGKTAYTTYCQDCHGANLDDGEFGGAPIRGSHFNETYVGSPASALFQYINSAMPPDRPGQLGDQTYADIAAYILQRNGFQAGNAELPKTIDALDLLILKR